MKYDFFISPKFNDLVLTHTKVYGFIIQLCPSQKKRDEITELRIKQIKNRKRMETTTENTDQISRKNKIDDILKSFEIFDGIYKREQVDVAIGRKDEITSFLIDILMKIVSNPTKFIEIENYYAHIYALMLLGSFKENKAHKVIVDLFSLPEDILEELFGELIVEDLSAIFFRTSHGRFDLIKTLALNKNAGVASRDAALKALVFAVAEGMFPREELVLLLDQLFKDNPISYSWDFGDRLAHHVHDVYPEELMDTIGQAYKDELISPGFISFQDFENALKSGKEKHYERKCGVKP